MVGVVLLFLKLSGKAWSRRQELIAAQGRRRSYRVLEAARGRDIGGIMQQLLEDRLASNIASA